MMSSRIAFFTAVLLALSSAAGQTRIDIWYSLGQNFGAPLFEEFVDRFNADHDALVANTVYSGSYGDTVIRAQAAVAAGNVPHVLMLEQTRGPGFVDAGAILPLQPFIDAHQDFDLSDIPEPLLATCRIDGVLYCLPFNPSTPVIFYNKDMFRESGLDPVEDFPRTWEDLIEIGAALARYGGSGQLTQWAFGLPAAPNWLFDAWLGQAGGSYLNAEGDAFVFDGDAGRRVIEFWNELIERDVARPFAGAANAISADFFGGNVAMMMASTATLENRFVQADFDLGVAPFWCGEQCYVPIGGANLYLMADTTEQEQQAAWEFLSWVLEPERTAEFAANTGYMAVRTSALDTDIMRSRFQERPEARITYDQMESHGHPRTLVAFWNEVESQITVLTELVLLDGADPQTALNAASAEANRLLAVYAR